jgi:hypothetical protein
MKNPYLAGTQNLGISGSKAATAARTINRGVNKY